jgi:L-ascorbate metabolism protein UlaG (beta-lactamase superfamily)
VAETSRSISRTPFLPNPLSWTDEAITAAWLGHSTVLINFYGFKILTDPVLFNRIGADVSVGTVGPKRLVAPALHVRQLPPLDLVLISHAHMDHLDPATLRALPGKPYAVTAHATEDLLRGTKLKEPHALAWGEKARIQTKNGDAEVEAFEVRHWGARWRYDKYRGYNGYIVSREGRKLIFGGDTAWTTSFRQLRNKGPFEMAIMPIGAYDPWVNSHCTPEEAVRMANDAGATYVLPIHHKTFAFGREGTAQPMQRLRGTIEEERIGWRDIGQTFQLT